MNRLKKATLQLRFALNKKAQIDFATLPNLLLQALKNNPNIHKYNLLTNYEDTLLALVEVEEDPSLLDELITSDSNYAPKAVLNALVKTWRELEEDWDNEEFADWNKEEYKKLSTGFGVFSPNTIYGAMGWDRYEVDSLGNVWFSNYHGKDKTRKKAKEIGFKLR